MKKGIVFLVVSTFVAFISCNDKDKDVTYSVVFNMQGHGIAPDRLSLSKGALVPRPQDPKVEGMIFEGWYQNEYYTKIWDFENDRVTSNTNLYAKWEHEYMDLGEAGKWAICNLGAERPEEIGLHFAWGATEAWYDSISDIGNSNTFFWKIGHEDGYTYSVDIQGVEKEGDILSAEQDLLLSYGERIGECLQKKIFKN